MILLLLPASAQNISTSMQQVHRTYSTRDGLPQTTVQALEADQRGWLWAATQNGVAYNNGRRWQELPAFNRAIQSGFWQGRRILADQASDLWFATQGDGIFHLHARSATPPERWNWTHYTGSEGLPSDTVLVLHEDKTGTIWAGTMRGLAVYQDSTWTSFALPDMLTSAQIFALHEDGERLLLGSDKGLFAFEHGTWSGPLLSGELRHRFVFALYEDHTGTLWAGLQGGIAKRVSGIWHTVREEAIDAQRRLNDNYVAIAEQANGSLAFALRNGGLLRRHRDGTWDTLDERNGLPSRFINALYAHPDGSFWVGTASGLAILRPDTWRVVDDETGIEPSSLWAIAEMQDGAMWFGSDRFLSIYENGQWRTLQGPDGKPLAYTLAIHEARDGTVWIGNRRGLFAYSNGQWSFTEHNTFIYAIVERPDGTLLIGTKDGVWQYAEDGFTRFAPEQTLLKGPVRALQQQADGTLWFGAAETGLLRYDGVSWQHFNTEDGLPDNSILDVFEDAEGLLWIATTQGLALYDGTSFRVFTDETPVRLPDRFTYRIEQDHAGRYYVSTNLGIARLTPVSPAPPSTDQPTPAQRQFTVEHFGLADGLPELEANQGASLRDSQGRIWFGLIAGAAMLDPGTMSASGDPLPMTIKQIDISNLDDSAFAALQDKASGPVALSHTQHDLTFTYSLGAPGSPDQVRYQTQLLGYDAEPTPWTETYARTYTNLPSGSYSFVVVGRKGSGEQSLPAEFAFHIARPPWATWWAYSTYLLLSGLAIVGLVRWQTERVRRRDAQQAAIEQERLSREVAEARAHLLHSENCRLAEQNAANEFQQRVLDGTSEAIFALDLDGKLSLSNLRLEELTGFPKDQLVNLAFITLFTPSSTPAVQKALDAVLRDKQSVRAVNVRLALADQPYLSLTLSPLMKANVVTGIIGLAEDVTEKRNLEQFRDDMLRMFVHDLRNPLGVVLMVSRELRDAPNMPPKLRSEMAEMTVKNSEQALDLVNKLLDVSRLEAQKMPLQCEPVDLNEIIQGIEETMRPLFAEGEITFDIVLSPRLPKAFVDASLLHRVLQNLLSNAVRHTPKHGTITLSGIISADRLHLRVADTGSGIAPSLRDHLFEKFATDNRDSGIGLGLAFCRLAAEAMHGEIWLDETVEEGTTFVLSLPTAPKKAQPTQPRKKQKRPSRLTN